MSLEIAFSGHGIDRADHVRVDAERLDKLRRDSSSRIMQLDGLNAVLDEELRLCWSSADDFNANAELVFLGLQEGAALFAPIPDDGDNRPAYMQRPDWTAMSQLPADELALYGGARSLVDWHARHRFCARCGAPTVIAKGGWQRDCPACKAQHFPRTDPVAIMLVENNGDLLLGRGDRYPPRSYSALAGFIEPGEAIEEGVAREVLEEAGVHVHTVQYVASQPWPFPSQLMIGCYSKTDNRDLTVDYTELEDARWFSRTEVEEAMSRGKEAESFVPPPPTAIAYHLLKWWLEREE